MSFFCAAINNAFYRYLSLFSFLMHPTLGVIWYTTWNVGSITSIVFWKNIFKSEISILKISYNYDRIDQLRTHKNCFTKDLELLGKSLTYFLVLIEYNTSLIDQNNLIIWTYRSQTFSDCWFGFSPLICIIKYHLIINWKRAIEHLKVVFTL